MSLLKLGMGSVDTSTEIEKKFVMIKLIHLKSSIMESQNKHNI